jgi:hypothetical protein
MPSPALASLARLLPLLAEGGGGGMAASLGRGIAAEDVIGSTLGNLFGGAKAFGSEAELGGALRKISDLHATIEAAQQALSQKSQQREEISSKAREDERLYSMSDPRHKEQLAQLAKQEQSQQESMRQAQREMNGLRARAQETLNPQSAMAGRVGRAAVIGGAGQLASSAIPAIARNLPGVEAATNLAAFGAGPTNSAIVGQMAGSLTGAASNIGSGVATGAGIGSLGGPGGAALGAAIGGLASSATELSKMPIRLKDWSEALIESQRHLSRFSPALAQAVAQSDVRGLRRDIGSAQVTGSTTAELMKSVDGLKDALQPLKDQLTVGLGAVLSQLVQTLTMLVPLVETAVEVGAKAVDTMTAGQAELGKLLEASKKNIELEKTRQLQQRGDAVGSASDAIKRLLNEDRSKPRQVPRR